MRRRTMQHTIQTSKAPRGDAEQAEQGLQYEGHGAQTATKRREEERNRKALPPSTLEPSKQQRWDLWVDAIKSQAAYHLSTR